MLIRILFFAFYPYTNLKWQMQNSREEQKNNMKVPPFPSLIPNIFLQVLLFFILYQSWSLLQLFLKLKSDVLFVMPPYSPAVTSPQCLHSRYYFWLSLLHLGAQWSLFHFPCHNAIAQISLRGIALLEMRITYVVSQTHPSSLYPTGADDQWVCQCQGLRTKKQSRRKKRVFWKHVTLAIIHHRTEAQNNMNPPYQNPDVEP